MISIVSVNYKSIDWATLLTESAFRFSSEVFELLIVNNTPSHASFKGDFGGARMIQNEGEPSHGEGLNLGVRNAWGDEVLILDIDCHLLSHGWENAFRAALKDHHCVTVSGSKEKPIRPACLFMKTRHARCYDWRATPGYQGHRITPEGFDVGIRAYNIMMAENQKIRWMDKTDLGLSRYNTLTGEEYGLFNTFYIYHHWHGTHLLERNKVDYIEHDLMAEKEKLFACIPWRKKVRMA